MSTITGPSSRIRSDENTGYVTEQIFQNLHYSFIYRSCGAVKGMIAISPDLKIYCDE
ncbi:hypothetical protein V7O66_12360 [Methanolobus sp. ZRKC3]|uniref:hypothetical protein n=1 Tax=Methanolobus sp. ZRKC3 TaxID=3125786 RepID=UPI0032523AC3